jgi:hypothetical protein
MKSNTNNTLSKPQIDGNIGWRDYNLVFKISLSLIPVILKIKVYELKRRLFHI